MRLLIVGGYGVFGGRVARLLVDCDGLTLLVAGRSEAKAARFCRTLQGPAEIVPCTFDRDGDIEAQLAVLRPDVVVDAAGPFQLYGADPYRVVAGALACGAHYIDLADGTDFVAGITRFDNAAREAGRAVLSGASTLPVLSAAVVRRLARDMAQVETIMAGIAPSPRAGLGLSVVRAFASYAGKPVQVLRDGRPAVAHGAIDSRRCVVAPPGAVPLGRIRFSLADAPDLRLMAAEWPGLQAVWTGAGPRPALLHRGLSTLAWLVRLRLLPSLVPLAPMFHWVLDRFGWGEHRSGMVVAVTGRDAAGAAVARSWHVVAEGDDGPMIPAMAAAALVRRMLSGVLPSPGARPALRDLELEDYEQAFAPFRIACGSRDDAVEAEVDGAVPLYERVLGAAFERLPPAVQDLHRTGTVMVASGRAAVSRGRGPLARLVAALFRFPRETDDGPVRVEIRAGDGAEVWRRDFAGRRFTSVQFAGRGRFAGLVVERFGPFRFGLALVAEPDRLRLVPRRWSAFGLPMPRAWCAHGDSYETVADGRFRFNVEIRLPLAGLVVGYRGWLECERA